MQTPRQILEKSETIAVVGASPYPTEAANWVPAHMQYHGWRIIPVTEQATEIFGERAYPRLADIPEPVDLVNIFRTDREPGDIVREAIAIGAHAVWLQLHVVCPDGPRLADEAGIPYIEDNCVAIERTLGYLTRRNRTAPTIRRNLALIGS